MSIQRTGYVGNLTQNEAAILARLRQLFEPQAEIDRAFGNDVVLLKFCRARDFDEKKVVDLLNRHFSWRNKPLIPNASPKLGALSPLPVSALYRDGPSESIRSRINQLKKFYPTGYHHTSKDGKPLYIDCVGKLDAGGLLSTCTEEEILEFFISECEKRDCVRFAACSLAAGKVIESSIAILDLKGLSFRTVTHSTMRKLMKFLSGVNQDHYPETLHTMFIVNAPRVFSLAWSFVKPLLDEKTLDKIKIFGDSYYSAICEEVPEEHIPQFLGGRCRCPPGNCLDQEKGPWMRPDLQRVMEQHHWSEIQNPEFIANFHTPPAPPPVAPAPPAAVLPAVSDPAASVAPVGSAAPCAPPSGGTRSPAPPSESTTADSKTQESSIPSSLQEVQQTTQNLQGTIPSKPPSTPSELPPEENTITPSQGSTSIPVVQGVAAMEQTPTNLQVPGNMQTAANVGNLIVGTGEAKSSKAPPPPPPPPKEGSPNFTSLEDSVLRGELPVTALLAPTHSPEPANSQPVNLPPTNLSSTNIPPTNVSSTKIPPTNVPSRNIVLGPMVSYDPTGDPNVCPSVPYVPPGVPTEGSRQDNDSRQGSNSSHEKGFGDLLSSIIEGEKGNTVTAPWYSPTFARNSTRSEDLVSITALSNSPLKKECFSSSADKASDQGYLSAHAYNSDSHQSDAYFSDGHTVNSFNSVADETSDVSSPVVSPLPDVGRMDAMLQIPGLSSGSGTVENERVERVVSRKNDTETRISNYKVPGYPQIGGGNSATDGIQQGIQPNERFQDLDSSPNGLPASLPMSDVTPMNQVDRASSNQIARVPPHSTTSVPADHAGGDQRKQWPPGGAPEELPPTNGTTKSIPSEAQIESDRAHLRVELDVLLSELSDVEAMHMNSLQEWGKTQIELQQEVSQYAIERAAKYYDALFHRDHCDAVVSACTHEFQHLTANIDLNRKEIESCTADLRAMQSKNSREFASGVALNQKATDAQQKLVALTQVEESFVRRKAETEAELVEALSAMKVAQTRFDTLAQPHWYCSWNCSVAKAKKYYVTKNEHEKRVESEMRQIESIHKRLRAVNILLRRMDSASPQTPQIGRPQGSAGGGGSYLSNGLEKKLFEIEELMGPQRNRNEEEFWSCDDLFKGE